MIWIGDVNWFLFGSFALGTQDAYSDLDLMFEGPLEADLERPYWVRQRSILARQVPHAEVWLSLPDEKRLVPFTEQAGELEGSNRLYDFVRAYRRPVSAAHLSRLLVWFSSWERRRFTNEQEYLLRTQAKHDKLAELIDEWEKSGKPDAFRHAA